MPTDPNLEFLSFVHILTSGSSDAMKALALAIARSENGVVTIPLDGAAALQVLLTTQNRVISGLVEQNQQIVDHVEELINRIEQK